MIISDKEQLRKICKQVSLFEAPDIIRKLEEELANSKMPGIGLSANQIGIDAQVSIIRLGKYILDLVNPQITDKYDLCLFSNEGCLSFENEWITTKRYNEICVKDSLHPNGIIATGLLSVVIQHEVGHLFGEVMYDYQIKEPKGRNDKCWCGSDRKFKVCCEGKIIK